VAQQAASGRKPKPAALRLVTGRGEGKDSAGRDVPAPVETRRGAPAKPDELSPDADFLWDLIAEQWNDLLKPADAASMEVVCETFARWREAVRFRRERAILGSNSQGIVAAPWVGIEERASKDFRAWCAEYGLTPAAEKNMTGGDEGGEVENPFA
jgi:P27 family predicted phage terminase small subunit